MSSVQSVERAFAILRALASGPARVTELADRVGLAKSTVSRLLSTLDELGAVEQLETGGSYRIGAGMREIAAATHPGRSLIEAARPQLIELSRLTGEATGLSVADGAEMLYLDQVNPDAELQVRDWTGTRIPMHAVPSGQVVLAAFDDARVQAYVAAPMASFTPRTLVDGEALLARLAEVRRDGYAWAVEEFAPALSSVAAGIRDTSGAVVASLHVYGPTYRLPGVRNPGALGQMVAERAAAIVMA